MGSIPIPIGCIREIRKRKAKRKCKTRGCKTILTMYNMQDICSACKQRKATITNV